ncbi:MAG: hypothetical protein ACK5Q5_00035 [Planctomycetaceae bacterium]
MIRTLKPREAKRINIDRVRYTMCKRLRSLWAYFFRMGVDTDQPD